MDGVTPAMLKFAVSSFLVLSLLGVWSCQVGVGPDTRSDILQSSGGYQVQLIAGDEESGFQDGVGQEARFKYPLSVIRVDNNDNIFVLDARNNAVRKITETSVSTLLAFPKRMPKINAPVISNIALNRDNEVYYQTVAPDNSPDASADDLENCWYRQTSYEPQTIFCEPNDDAVVFKNPYFGDVFFTAENQLIIDSSVGNHIFNSDGSLTPTDTKNPKYTDSQGNYFTINYLASTLTNILMTRPDGSNIEIGKGRTSSSPSTPTPRATPEGCSSFDEYCAVKGYVDGPKETAEFHTPEHLVIGRDDTVYVSDTGNKKLRTIAPGSLEVDTVPLDFDEPLGDMALDRDGNIIAAYGNRIIKITLPVKAQQIP